MNRVRWSRQRRQKQPRVLRLRYAPLRMTTSVELEQPVPSHSNEYHKERVRAHWIGRFYSLGRGQREVTVVPMPPRGRKTPWTSAQTGSAALTTSSRTWLTMFSWKMPRLR